MQKNSQNNYIDIGNLSVLLNDKQWSFDKDQMQIFEEVVFLCINDNFIKDVQKIRNYFIEKYPKINIPTKNTPQAENIICLIYAKDYKKYKDFIEEMLKKYKLIPGLYWEDKIEFVEWGIDNEIERAKEYEYARREINKSYAMAEAIERSLQFCPLNLMDNIVLRNTPFLAGDDSYPLWNNPRFTRKPNENILVSLESKYGVRINIGFPAYSSLSEMVNLLKNNYKKIQEFRAEVLPIPAKKDYRKSELKKSIDTYMMYVREWKIEKIAIELDKKYGGEHTYESINKIVERMKKDSERFNKSEKKQERQDTAIF